MSIYVQYYMIHYHYINLYTYVFKKYNTDCNTAPFVGYFFAYCIRFKGTQHCPPADVKSPGVARWMKSDPIFSTLEARKTTEKRKDGILRMLHCFLAPFHDKEGSTKNDGLVLTPYPHFCARAWGLSQQLWSLHLKRDTLGNLFDILCVDMVNEP